MIPAWAKPYMQIPFVEKGRTLAGCDCWGLYRLVAEQQFGVHGLPDYAETYTGPSDRLSVAAAITNGLAEGWRAVCSPEPGALVVLRLMGKPWHVAVVLDRTWFLHCLDRVESTCERFNSITWARRIEGFYVRA